MANEEHLAILRKGVEAWNRWIEENPKIVPNLREANLYGTILNRADLSSAYMIYANLNGANLSNTNLSNTNLSNADLSDADMTGANLSSATLNQTVLNKAVLSGVNFSNVLCLSTTFANLDLSTVIGLDTVRHRLPSSISVDTLFLSKGKIPEVFLRGCGVPESLITFLPSLLEQAIQFYSCFISYSHKDQEFARRLHDRLQGAGIRCWLDEHQLNPGDPLHPTIYEAIRVYDKVLLCCSETALKSWWVDKEFNRMIRNEEEYDDFVLIPLNLDGYLFRPECEGWIADDVKQRLVADFTMWKDHDGFENAVKSVIKGLRTDGGKLPPPEPKMKKKKSNT